MTVFNYIALDNNGKQTKGVLEGDSARKIRHQLREQGLLPTHIEELQSENKNQSKNNSLHLFSKNKLSSAELAMFTYELSSLLAAGMPVAEALHAAAKQNEKAHIKNILHGVRAKVNEGFSLANSLAAYPKAFPEVYQATVAAGEQSGHLDLVLTHLADYLDRQQQTQQKVQQALIYPSMMTMISLAIVVFLLIYVVPKMVGVFTDANQTLPPLTQLLITLSDGAQNHGWWIALLIATLFTLFRIRLKHKPFKFKYHQTLLRIPVIGKMSKMINSARFSRTLGILSNSGVPVVQGMQISATLITNLPMRKAVEAAADRVREGASINKAIDQTGYFLPTTVHFIANGENSGQLEEMLQRAAENQDRKVTSFIETSLSMFEPVLILLMGSIVLFIVLAILLPMFEMTQMIG